MTGTEKNEETSFCTVTRLMGLVDRLCNACVDDVVASDQAIRSHESNASTLHAALESELTRLFTPLSDEQIESGRNATFSTGNPFCPCDSKTMRKAVRWAESQHGIGETK